MTTKSFYDQSIGQLIDFLAVSKKTLMILMNQRGATVMIRRKRSEIEILEEHISLRQLSPGRC